MEAKLGPSAVLWRVAMFRRIVVSTDGSPRSNRAIKSAAAKSTAAKRPPTAEIPLSKRAKTDQDTTENDDAAMEDVEDDDTASDPDIDATDSEEDEDDEDGPAEIVVGEDDENVFDIDQFNGKTFDEEGAKKAFRAWKRERDLRKVPLSFMQHAPHMDDDIPEDVFRANQKTMTLRLLEAQRVRLAGIREELAQDDLTPKERKQLQVIEARAVRAIDEREEELRD